ncbi:MAG: exodeoxyribonuclease VII small subunit [Bdellovibrionaceae bacterium]|nr:exodeoxyribonuclease VII small subunit [Pseudobdellovibrionaceae bacterium]
MDFEKKLARLEEIVSKMEKGDLPLEESLKLFEEGVKLSRECHQRLNEAEQRVKILTAVDENGRPVAQEFVPEES